MWEVDCRAPLSSGDEEEDVDELGTHVEQWHHLLHHRQSMAAGFHPRQKQHAIATEMIAIAIPKITNCNDCMCNSINCKKWKEPNTKCLNQPRNIILGECSRSFESNKMSRRERTTSKTSTNLEKSRTELLQASNAPTWSSAIVAGKRSPCIDYRETLRDTFTKWNQACRRDKYSLKPL
eukprot:6087981-Amphidinium_carterae.1